MKAHEMRFLPPMWRCVGARRGAQVSVVTFLVYTAAGNKLTPAVAFTALSLFGVLRMPLISLPNIINQAIAASVAVNRIKAFLCASELHGAHAG